MLGPLALALALSAGDPRPELVALQLAGRLREALARTEQELAEEPARARRLGLSYLRGHLLDRLGQPVAALEAFAAAMAETPALAPYARYRLALEQERMGHPEVAAGLVATVAAADPPPGLLQDAIRLLGRTLSRGGDCRLLRGLAPERMAAAERRMVLLAQADCSLEAGEREHTRGLLVRLLEERRDDEVARGAAERLARLAGDAERGRLPWLVGMALFEHRELERAIHHLQRSLVPGMSAADDFEARYTLLLCYLEMERYGPAAVGFGEIAERARRRGDAERRARALHQQGRAWELLGEWHTAAASFRAAYLAEPAGAWAAPSLLAAFRLQRRSGQEQPARELYELLLARWEWREPAGRAALFLAASDLVRGRAGRARAWLSQAAARLAAEDRVEVAYWQGRLEEIEGDERRAVAAYVEAIRPDPAHPLARGALARLRSPGLARAAAAEGRRLAASPRQPDQVAAWLLLGDDDLVGGLARRRARKLLAANRFTAPYLQLAEVPAAAWPLWQVPARRPEDLLLTLGVLRDGAPAVRDHFPEASPSFAYTGALLLARAGETGSAVRLAEAVRARTPERLPLALQPRPFQVLLYPLPWREIFRTQARQRGVDPELLVALAREESRFDRFALTPAVRGLTLIPLPTARRLAAEHDIGPLEPVDLDRPEVAIALGAIALAELLARFQGAAHLAVAAHDAGAPQANLWRTHCYSAEPEEYFTKVPAAETRVYLRRVLASWAQYERLYGGR